LAIVGTALRQLEKAEAGSGAVPTDLQLGLAVPTDLGVATELRVTPDFKSLHASETVCCALWMLLRHWQSPAHCLTKTVSLGG
jgi:hypothetical protein